MKKNLIFTTLIFSIILTLMIFFGISRTVLSQISGSSSAQKISTVTSGAKISVTVKPATTTFRYIKDDISKSGWVAIREMKFYDANNNEIKPVNANASCDWCGYGTPPSYSVGPKGIFDGNWETVWNAGETATDCNWYIPHTRDDGIYGVGCSSSTIRTAWINVDLGAPVSLSKIKIHIMGDSDNRLDSLSGSIDGKNYVDLCKIQASKDTPLVDLGPTGDWIECNLSGFQNTFTSQGGTTQQISLLANNQKNIYVYIGDTINYTWQGPDGAGYTYSSTYTADAPDNCSGGIIQQGEVKPWVANTVQGSTSAQVQQCQVGRTYTITYIASNSSGSIVKDSIKVNVLTGQRPISQNSNQNTVNQYNPFDTSVYTGRTTIPGVTDKNQNIQTQNQNQIQTQTQTGSNQNSLINSLSDTISKINSILGSAKNLSQEDQDIISKAMQTILNAVQNLIASLIQKTAQVNSNNTNTNNTNNNNNINSNISLLANNQTNLTAYVGDIINYTWQGPDGAGYTYSSKYVADAPDNCPGGITSASQEKPWVANTKQGSVSAQVQQCQAGRTYTITYMAKDSVGTTVAQTSIIIKVLNNQSQINNKDKIGVYFWGGNLQSSSNYLQDGINLAKRIGTKTIRIAISSKDMPLYKLSNQCSSDSLAQMAKNFENLFKDPQFDTIIITAYDQTGLSCSGKKYLDPSFYTSENIQKMKQEYKDLANYLGQNFPNKKFIIANWESDNDIYCGAAYGFNPSGNQCDYRNSIEAFKKFISVRTEAIKESNQPNVFSGVEFNIVNYLKDNNLPSTLYDVIPYVPADYYLYSSYESINNLYKDNGINLLNSDISKIKQVLSNSGKNQNNLIIGEYGFGSGDSEQNKNLLSKATETFLNDGSIQYAIIWNLLNSGGPFGLFDGQGNLTPQGDYIRQVLEENNQ